MQLFISLIILIASFLDEVMFTGEEYEPNFVVARRTSLSARIDGKRFDGFIVRTARDRIVRLSAELLGRS